MRKEAVFAIIGGIVFGLVIAFGVWRANSSFKPEKEKSASPAPSPKNPSFKIAIDSPENEDVVTKDSVTVSGITSPLSWVSLSGESSDYFVQSDAKGVFSEEVDLTSGVNQIKVTAFDQKGQEAGTKVLVVFSSAFEVKLPPEEKETVKETSTESAIRARVEEKVKEAMTKPKAYLGTVTDITDSTIQIKSLEGEIRQISVAAENLTVIKTGKTSKEVKLTDIAIGDFIVAMGFKNGNQVLSAQRILITDKPLEPAYKAFYGSVEAATKKSATVSGTEIIPGKNTDVFEVSGEKVSPSTISKAETGRFVIYVTAEEAPKTTPRSVLILPKP